MPVKVLVVHVAARTVAGQGLATTASMALRRLSPDEMDPLGRRPVALDPMTNEVTTVLSHGLPTGHTGGLAVDEGALWLADPSNGRLLRLASGRCFDAAATTSRRAGATIGPGCPLDGRRSAARGKQRVRDIWAAHHRVIVSVPVREFDAEDPLEILTAGSAGGRSPDPTPRHTRATDDAARGRHLQAEDDMRDLPAGEFRQITRRVALHEEGGESAKDEFREFASSRASEGYEQDVATSEMSARCTQFRLQS